MAVTRIQEGGLGTDSFNLPITLNGTDGSSTHAGDNIILDASASGVDAGERLLYEGIPPDIPSNISEDISVVDGTTLSIDDGGTLNSKTGSTAYISGQTMPTEGGLWSGRNIIINGNMAVAQRVTSTTGVGNAAGYFGPDRWAFNGGSTAGRLTMTQTADGPPGIANCLKLDCTTADTSIAASESLLIRQFIEGQNAQHLAKGTKNATTIGVSFWAKQNATRNIVVILSDDDNTRWVSSLVTVGTSWERYTVTFPADGVGALNDDNAKSITLGFYLHNGSNATSGTLATKWEAYVAANTAVGVGSFYSSTDNTFFLTGVQMEAGSPTTFEHESYAQTLQKCQRYYVQLLKSDSTKELVINGAQSGATNFNCFLPYSMRAAPTITWPATNGVRGEATSVNISSVASTMDTNNYVHFNATITSGLSANTASFAYAYQGATTLNAEL